MSAREFIGRIFSPKRSAFSGVRLEPNERAVLKCLERNGSMNRRRIAALTRQEISSVCARVASLKELGLVDTTDYIKCPITGRMTQSVRVKPPRSRI